jgi:CheY-like chemotaxis protein
LFTRAIERNNRASLGSESMVNILVIDDVRVARESLKLLFEARLGTPIALEEAENGLEAVEKARTLHPDLVVVDFSMPGMDGVETARKIKEVAPRTPIILFTAHGETSLEKHAFKAGIAAMVSKGEESGRLVSLVKLLLSYGGKLQMP